MSVVQSAVIQRYTSRLLFAAAFMAGLFAPVLWECGPGWILTPARHEITRVSSPDNLEDGVLTLVRSAVGPSHLRYEVHVVRHGMRTDKREAVFVATKLEDARLVWQDRRLLEIHYRRARIENFTSDWDFPSRKDWAVEIRLAPSSADFSYLRNGPDLKTPMSD